MENLLGGVGNTTVVSGNDFDILLHGFRYQQGNPRVTHRMHLPSTRTLIQSIKWPDSKVEASKNVDLSGNLSPENYTQLGH